MKTFISMAVIDNRQIFDKLMKTQQREQLEGILVGGIRSYLLKMIRHANVAAPLNLNIYDPEIALDFYACGIAGILLNYGRGKTVDVDRLSRQITQILMSLKSDDE